MPVGVDSGAGKDIVPLDWLVPSRVPEYVTVQAAAGNTECEILFVATTISVDDSASTTIPVDR